VQPTGTDPEGRSRAGDLDVLVGLDEIAGLEVLEVGQADTALEAFFNFSGIRRKFWTRCNRILH